jgi:predicted DNA-binding protein with PD1-like motif
MGAPDFTVHGAHLREAEVSLILEIFIIPADKKIIRERNSEFPELRTMKTVKE